MIILKILNKVGLTIVYPILYPLVIKPIDQLGCTNTGFFEGIKNIWADKKDKETGGK